MVCKRRADGGGTNMTRKIRKASMLIYRRFLVIDFM